MALDATGTAAMEFAVLASLSHTVREMHRSPTPRKSPTDLGGNVSQPTRAPGNDLDTLILTDATSRGSGGVSVGVAAGIGIGCGCAVRLVVLALFLFCGWKQHKKTRQIGLVRQVGGVLERWQQKLRTPWMLPRTRPAVEASVAEVRHEAPAAYLHHELEPGPVRTVPASRWDHSFDPSQQHNFIERVPAPEGGECDSCSPVSMRTGTISDMSRYVQPKDRGEARWAAGVLNGIINHPLLADTELLYDQTMKR